MKYVYRVVGGGEQTKGRKIYFHFYYFTYGLEVMMFYLLQLGKVTVGLECIIKLESGNNVCLLLSRGSGS